MQRRYESRSTGRADSGTIGGMRRAPRRSVLLTALLLVGAASVAAPAAAHNPPPVPTPADGAILDAVPTEVRLDYSAPILAVGSLVEVTGPDGEAAADGPTIVGEKDVVQPITDAGPGEYTVVWRVTSQDGHPVDGSSTFTVEAAEPTPPPTPAEPTTEPTPEQSTDGSEQTGDGPAATTGPTTTPPAQPSATAPADTAPAATRPANPDEGSNLLVRGGATVVVVALVAAVVLVVRRVRARRTR